MCEELHAELLIAEEKLIIFDYINGRFQLPILYNGKYDLA